MSYVVGNEGLIKDPFVVEEFQRLQAFLKGIEEKVGLPPENPDTKQPPTGPDKAPGVRWPQGPWVVGFEGVGIPNYPFYSIVAPPEELSEDQHNYAPPGIDNAILLEITSSVSPLNITGIRNPTLERRILGLFNRSGATVRLVSNSNESEENYRFDWGSSASIGDAIEMYANAVIWLLYNPVARKWVLFALPSSGDVGLPPELTGNTGGFPADFYWFSSSMVNNNAAVVRSLYEDNPGLVGVGTMLLTDPAGPGRISTTGAVIGNSAGVSAGVVPPFVRGVQNPIWTTILRTAASIADIKIWVVLTTVVPTNVDDLGAATIGFRFSTSAGDTHWVGVCNSGAAQTVSGVVGDDPVAADTLYRLQVRKVNSSVFFSVNGSEEVEVTTNLPADTVTLTWYCYVITNAAAAKAITWFRHHYRALLDP